MTHIWPIRLIYASANGIKPVFLNRNKSTFLFYISCFIALDQVRKQQIEVRQILLELDKRHREIDYLVERAKNVTIDPNLENEVINTISRFSNKIQ